MRLDWYLQRFCAQQVRRERATHAEVVFDVLQVISGISAAFECRLRLFAHIFGAEVRRFRSKIARFSVRFGAILARRTRASTVKHLRPLLTVAEHAQEKICSKRLNVRCVAREKLANLSMRIARLWVGFCRFLARDTCAADALRSEECVVGARNDFLHSRSVWM